MLHTYSFACLWVFKILCYCLSILENLICTNLTTPPAVQSSTRKKICLKLVYHNKHKRKEIYIYANLKLIKDHIIIWALS